METRNNIQLNDIIKLFAAGLTFKGEQTKHAKIVDTFLSSAIPYLKSLHNQPLSNSKTQSFIQQIKQLEQLGAFNAVLSKEQLQAICEDISKESKTIATLLNDFETDKLIQNLTENLYESNINQLQAVSLDNSLDEVQPIINKIKKLENSSSHRDIVDLIDLYHNLINKCVKNKHESTAIHFSKKIIDYLTTQLRDNLNKYYPEEQVYLHQKLANFHYINGCINYNIGRTTDGLPHTESALKYYIQAREADQRFEKEIAEVVNLLMMIYTEIISMLYQQHEIKAVKLFCEKLFQLYRTHSNNPLVQIDIENANALLKMWFNVEIDMMDKHIEQKAFQPLINTLQTLLLTAHALGSHDLVENIAGTWAQVVTQAYKHFLGLPDFDTLHKMFDLCEVCLKVINIPKAIDNINLYKIITNYQHGLYLMSTDNWADAKARFNAALSILSKQGKSENLDKFSLLIDKQLQIINQKLPNISSLNNSSFYTQPNSHETTSHPQEGSKRNQP